MAFFQICTFQTLIHTYTLEPIIGARLTLPAHRIKFQHPWTFRRNVPLWAPWGWWLRDPWPGTRHSQPTNWCAAHQVRKGAAFSSYLEDFTRGLRLTGHLQLQLKPDLALNLEVGASQGIVPGRISHCSSSADRSNKEGKSMRCKS